MPIIRVEKLKTVYHLKDTLNNFQASIRTSDVDRFVELLLDIHNHRIPFYWGESDYIQTRIGTYFARRGIKGCGNYIKNHRCIPVAIHLLVSAGKLKNKRDIANLYGYKTWCKSVDRKINELDLTTLALIDKTIRKEITNGKTSSSNKTGKFNSNSR